MTREEILKICENQILYDLPPFFDELTKLIIEQLIKEGLIESCYSQHPDFMNSSYAFIKKGRIVDVITENRTSWLVLREE